MTEMKEVIKKSIATKGSKLSQSDQSKKKNEEDMTKLLCEVISNYDSNRLQTEHAQTIEWVISEMRKACLFDIIN
jgi:hypothetical protein